MEYLPGGLTLEIPQGVFPLSTDSMVLADFVRLPKQAKVADLGSGCATLGMLLCAKWGDCTVTGFEIEEKAHAGALSNIARNNLSERLQSILGDLRETTQNYVPGSFAVCVSNPPYFTGGFDSKLPLARRDSACSTAELMEAASRLLKFGGDAFFIQKPDKLAQLISEGSKHGLEAKELMLVRHQADKPVALIALKLRKGAAAGLHLRELNLKDAQGNLTDDYRRIYHR